MILEEIKDLMNQLLEDHPDKDSHWDSWARRFIMGIDKTKDSAVRASNVNSIRFVQKSGHSDITTYEHQPITDMSSKFMPYAVRHHLTNAVIKWAESTTMTGKSKEDAESEVGMHLITAENLLDFC
jgi:hypothetical protein